MILPAFFKIIFSAILTIVIFLGGAFALYDVFYFMPHQAEIERLLSESDPEDKNPPEAFKLLIEVAHQNEVSPSAVVARELLSKLTPMHSQRALNWQLDFALWSLLVQLHTSKNQIYGLYCTLAYNGQGYGANKLSMRLFSRPLSELSDEEAATLVLVLKSPKQYQLQQNSLSQPASCVIGCYLDYGYYRRTRNILHTTQIVIS